MWGIFIFVMDRINGAARYLKFALDFSFYYGADGNGFSTFILEHFLLLLLPYMSSLNIFLFEPCIDYSFLQFLLLCFVVAGVKLETGRILLSPLHFPPLLLRLFLELREIQKPRE